MYITSDEQDAVLFFKLYLLARKQNYINYMEGARALNRAFNFRERKPSITFRDTNIFCGSCFNIMGRTHGGSFTLCCPICTGSNSMAYELQQLSHITGLSFRECLFCMCLALEDIGRANTVIAFEKVLFA